MATIIQPSSGLLSFDILINGAKIPDVVEVNEISIETEVNRIAMATVIIEDGGAIGAVNDPFTNSEGSDFIPGNEIEISLGCRTWAYMTRRYKQRHFLYRYRYRTTFPASTVVGTQFEKYRHWR